MIRAVIYELTPAGLASILRDGEAFRVVEGIPDGARIVSAGYGPDDRIWLTVTHQSFPEVGPDELLPRRAITVDRIRMLTDYRESAPSAHVPDQKEATH